MKTLSDIVRERINKYLGEKNLTQYRLAELSGLPFATIKSIMQKRTKGISLKTILLLAKGFGMTGSEFINDKLFNPDDINFD